MSPREIELDEALDKYKKAEAEKPREPKAEEQEEFEKARKEKKLKKPGSVSRFFNQFGIGKYWERMNDYFEQEEQMEKGAAEKEAAKETVGDVRAAAEEKTREVKAVGAKMPTKILESAARAGAGAEEAAPVITEAKVEEAVIEQEAEAAKAELDEEIEVFVAEPESVGLPSAEDIIRAHEAGRAAKPEAEDVEIIEKESMEDEIRRKYENAPLREIDMKIKSIESDIRREANPDLKEMLEAEKNILAKIKKEKTPAKAPEKKIEARDLPAWDEAEELKKVKILAPEDLPPGEEFEAAEKEQREKEVPTLDKVEVLEEEVEEPVEEEMVKAKVEAIPLDKKKQKEELEEISIDFGFKRGDKVPVVDESGKVDLGWEIINFGKDKKTAMVTKLGKDGEPMIKTIDLEELKQWKRDEEFFRKGKKESRKRMWRGVKTLTRARGESAAQRKKKAEESFKIAEPEIKKKPKTKKIKLKIAS